MDRIRKYIANFLGKNLQNEPNISNLSSNIECTDTISEANISPMKTLRFLNSDYIISDSWIDLFSNFILLDVPNQMPDKSWYEESRKLIEKIGNEEFLSIGYSWINNCIIKSKEYPESIKKLGIMAAGKLIQESLGSDEYSVPDWVKKIYGDDVISGGFFKLKKFISMNHFQNYFYQSLGGRILRGFLHSSLILNDHRLIELLDQVALNSPNTSQDAIHIYSNLPKELALPKLTLLRSRVTNKNILSRINKTITEIAKNQGLSKFEIEETIINDYSINENGEYIEYIDDTKCTFRFENTKNLVAEYELKNGTIQKSIPKSINTENSPKIKKLKKNITEIKQSLSVHRKRIEEFYLFDRKINYQTFEKNYLNHGLIRILSKDLIWNFKNSNININLIYRNGYFVNSKEEKNTDNLLDCIVSLWHPIESLPDNVFEWRSYIINNQIFQPFKQAFREVYLLTDAEVSTNIYSNRYASHILKKDHLSALCKVRGWSPSGIINDGKITYKIPGSDLKSEYSLRDVFLGEYSKTYGSAHVSTDQVRFFKKKEPLILTEVPTTIFSEVMRDIDLFVGVTSIGNDPEWYDRGVGEARVYWSAYSNGELTDSSKVRVSILKNIIPKMKIHQFCSFDGKYLKVVGKLRNYKIHMGSGNILMEPNDQYLCIVPDKSAASPKKVFIPFEGDNLLSIIISKAILLVDDSKIVDLTILNQINSK